MTAATVSRRSTALSGYRLVLGWTGWAGVAILVATIGAFSFESFFTGDPILVQSQGPLALQPGLARDLEQRLFDIDLLTTGQRTVHVAGLGLFALTAVMIFLRRSRDWVILLSSGTLLAVGAALFVPSSLLAAEKPSWEAAVHFLGVFDARPEFWRSVAGVTIVLFAVLFPDGQFTSRWTRVFTVAVLIEVALWAALPGVAIFDVARWPNALEVVWTLGIALAVVAAQLDRYWRVSDLPRRRQTRLVVVSLAGAVSMLSLIWVLSPDLSNSVDLGLVLVTDRLQTIYDLNLLSLLTLSLVLFPVSIGVSVARHRLFDMDLLLNRALVYGILTGVIALVLFGSVAIVGGLVVNRFGRGLGIAMTGVLMIAAFQPLRSRIQSQVDRRFYRDKYNADRTVEAFARQIRDEADLQRLESGLRSIVDETLRPAVTVVYLDRKSDLHRAAHRALEPEYIDQPNRPIVTAELAHRSAPLRELSEAGAELVIPLVSHGQLVGVLELGRRLGERSYSGLDHDLLCRLAEVVAPAFRFAELAERHAREAVEKQRYEQELQLARSIQRDLLPKRLPDLPGWQLFALYEPAREVGGDLYDFIELPSGDWVVIVADVTDKGIPAAMVMATCRSMLRGVASGSDRPGPGEVLGRVNDLLVADTPENMFVTCFFAVVDPTGGRLTFANAGHSLPLRWAESVSQIEARGMPLGLMPGMEYDEHRLTLAPGEGVLFYSDGVTEARDPGGEMYGTARFEAWLRGREMGAGLLDDLMAELAGFTHDAEDLGDDVTLVALYREPDQARRPSV